MINNLEMDGNNSAVSVYAEAKGEYTKQLTLFIVPTFHMFFMDCLKQSSEEELNQKRQLWKFQEILSQIPEWNVDKVQREIQKFIVNIQCDYLEELVTAVFIAHTKVLTAIRIGNKNKRIQITIPKLEHFLHRALSECSRLLWSSAYLFHNELSQIEKQKNHRQIEALLHDGIGQAIRGLLPVKNILKDYLSESNEADDVDVTEPLISSKSHDDVHDDVPDVLDVVPEPPVVVPEPPVVVPEPPVVVPEPPVVVPEPPVVVPEPPVVVPEPPVVVPEPPVVLKEDNISTPSILVVDTEPSVHFSDYNQVIKKTGGITDIQYVESTNNSSDDIQFSDDTYESLSDFEDITDYPSESLSTNDFEQL